MRQGVPMLQETLAASTAVVELAEEVAARGRAIVVLRAEVQRLTAEVQRLTAESLASSAPAEGD